MTIYPAIIDTLCISAIVHLSYKNSRFMRHAFIMSVGSTIGYYDYLNSQKLFLRWKNIL